MVLAYIQAQYLALLRQLQTVHNIYTNSSNQIFKEGQDAQLQSASAQPGVQALIRHFDPTSSLLQNNQSNLSTDPAAVDTAQDSTEPPAFNPLSPRPLHQLQQPSITGMSHDTSGKGAASFNNWVGFRTTTGATATPQSLFRRELQERGLETTAKQLVLTPVHEETPGTPKTMKRSSLGVHVHDTPTLFRRTSQAGTASATPAQAGGHPTGPPGESAKPTEEATQQAATDAVQPVPQTEPKQKQQQQPEDTATEPLKDVVTSQPASEPQAMTPCSVLEDTAQPMQQDAQQDPQQKQQQQQEEEAHHEEGGDEKDHHESTEDKALKQPTAAPSTQNNAMDIDVHESTGPTQGSIGGESKPTAGAATAAAVDGDTIMQDSTECGATSAPSKAAVANGQHTSTNTVVAQQQPASATDAAQVQVILPSAHEQPSAVPCISQEQQGPLIPSFTDAEVALQLMWNATHPDQSSSAMQVDDVAGNQADKTAGDSSTEQEAHVGLSVDDLQKIASLEAIASALTEQVRLRHALPIECS